MASATILSDNGVTSGSAGLKETGGNDGVLLLQTTTSGGAATTAVTVDNAQNVGVGVTPSAWSGSTALQVGPSGSIAENSSLPMLVSANAFGITAGFSAKYITSNYATTYLQYQGEHRWNTAPSGTAGNAITFTQAMTLDASGRLLVGLTSSLNANGAVQAGGFSDTRVVIDGSSTQGIYFTKSGADNGTYRVDASGNYNWFVKGAATANMTLDASGNLLVGTTSANASVGGLAVTSTSTTKNALVLNQTGAAGTSWNLIIGYYGVFGVTAVNSFLVANNGNVQNLNNSYGAISDIKLKDNIVDVTPKLADLMKVKVRNYNLKNAPEQKQIGVVAQELEQIFPSMVDEAIDRDEEGNDLGTTTKSVKYSVFVPMLIKAIQEQQILITSLTERITALEAK